jgi:translation initiation factor 1A
MAFVKKKKKPYKKKKKGTTNSEEEVFRVRTPRDKEVLGLLEQRLGGSRAKVICIDGKTRVCRIPGRLKRHLWVREGDIVIVEPWEFGGDEKGDVIFKYRPNQALFLRKQGHLKILDDIEEF